MKSFNEWMIEEKTSFNTERELIQHIKSKRSPEGFYVKGELFNGMQNNSRPRSSTEIGGVFYYYKNNLTYEETKSGPHLYFGIAIDDKGRIIDYHVDFSRLSFEERQAERDRDYY
jgi:hypothetical protein